MHWRMTMKSMMAFMLLPALATDLEDYHSSLAHLEFDVQVIQEGVKPDGTKVHPYVAAEGHVIMNKRLSLSPDKGCLTGTLQSTWLADSPTFRKITEHIRKGKYVGAQKYNGKDCHRIQREYGSEDFRITHELWVTQQHIYKWITTQATLKDGEVTDYITRTRIYKHKKGSPDGSTTSPDDGSTTSTDNESLDQPGKPATS